MPEEYFIQAVLPLKLDWAPTYRSVEPCHIGQRVVVKMGSREYVGVVSRTDVTPDLDNARIQHIITADSGLPDITPQELKLWEFIASYYMCSVGEVYKAAYPSLKTKSEEVSVSVLERLEKRLKAREDALLKKHNAAVTARLEAERDALRRQIAASSGKPVAAECDRVPAGKPKVISGPERYSRYVEMASRALEDGMQVLILTPEIAFCNALEQRLKPVFNDSLKVIDSTKTAVQRRRISDAVRDGEPCVVLGTRIAVFLPFRKLSCVIIDDEQDSSYKQTEPAPRYNGRDTALALASIHCAQAVLGTDSPSLETLYNCRTGKYSLESASSVKPSCMVVDIPAERRKNGMVGNFSRKLLEAAGETPGKIVLIRRWEKLEELAQEVQNLLPAREVVIMSLSELKSEGCEGAALICVMQADALVSKDDFRADERAVQLVTMLSSMAPRVVIQTASAERFSCSRTADDLLAERREFGFPPYTRLVEIRRSGSRETLQRFFLKKDQTLSSEKKKISAGVSAGCYVDVDPV